MKRIIESRKLFNSNATTDLATLKTTYRNFMKEWHPDKFKEDDALAEQAEAKSKTIIEAYHFLVSISPETHVTEAEEYTTTINSGIDGYDYKGSLLTITFVNGITYEYFGVPKNVYNKMSSSTTLARFARRHIFHSFVYRNNGKPQLKA